MDFYLLSLKSCCAIIIIETISGSRAIFLINRAFSIVNPLPYLLACQQETAVCDSNEQALSKKYCVIASLYVKRVLAYGMKLKLPAECGKWLKANNESNYYTFVSIHSAIIITILQDFLQYSFLSATFSIKFLLYQTKLKRVFMHEFLAGSSSSFNSSGNLMAKMITFAISFNEISGN